MPNGAAASHHQETTSPRGWAVLKLSPAMLKILAALLLGGGVSYGATKAMPPSAPVVAPAPTVVPPDPIVTEINELKLAVTAMHGDVKAQNAQLVDAKTELARLRERIDRHLEQHRR